MSASFWLVRCGELGCLRGLGVFGVGMFDCVVGGALGLAVLFMSEGTAVVAFSDVVEGKISYRKGFPPRMLRLCFWS